MGEPKETTALDNHPMFEHEEAGEEYAAYSSAAGVGAREQWRGRLCRRSLDHKRQPRFFTEGRTLSAAFRYLDSDAQRGTSD